VLFLLSSCKKSDNIEDYTFINNNYLYTLYFIKNNTDDTLKVDIYKNIKTVILKPNEQLTLTFLENYDTDSVKIYKLNNMNFPYIQFWKNKEPYNYNLNYFEYSKWKASGIHLEKRNMNGFEFYVNVNNYLFEIDTNNIIIQ